MGALEAFSTLSGRVMLGAQCRRSDAAKSYDVIDPATEDRIGQIPDSTEAEVEEAIQIANDAQRKWRKTNALHRAELLHEVARELNLSPRHVRVIRLRAFNKLRSALHIKGAGR